MKEMLSKHNLTELTQLYYHRTGRFICAVFTLAPHYESSVYV